MNADSPASSHPMGLRGWCPATTTPTVAVTRTTTKRLATAPSLLSVTSPATAPFRISQPSSTTSTPAGAAVTTREVPRGPRARVSAAHRPGSGDPDRQAGRFQGGADHTGEVGLDGVEIDGVLQPRGERGDDSVGVVAGPVEPAVHDPLYLAAQGREQGTRAAARRTTRPAR